MVKSPPWSGGAPAAVVDYTLAAVVDHTFVGGDADAPWRVGVPADHYTLVDL